MHYKNLKIYQLGENLRNELYNELNQIPYNWNIGEIDQVIRSSSSIVSNIVEGHSRRFYPKEHIRFLNIALGSSDETQNHIEILYKKGYLNKNRYEYYANRYKTLSIKILNFINFLRK